jgi:hypothetical protein
MSMKSSRSINSGCALALQRFHAMRGDSSLNNILRAASLGILALSVWSGRATAADDLAQTAMPVQSALVAAGSETSAQIKIQRPPTRPVKRAYFGPERASQEARQVADWVVDSGDNQAMPFAIVDKKNARVFIFFADGKLRGATPALLGLARGDDAVPGIGDRELSSIRPEERTTPSGRFLAALGENMNGSEILWVNYEAAISMHPVVTTNPQERRLQRLATATPLDNRVSYGCINVPAKFFEGVVRPSFTGTNGIVYVLPEVRLAKDEFAAYDVEARAQLQNASPPRPLTSAHAAH